MRGYETGGGGAGAARAVWEDDGVSGNYWQGERVRLRAVEPEDWEAHFLWNQDSDMMRRNDRIYFPQSREAAKRWARETAVREPALGTRQALSTRMCVAASTMNTSGR